MLWCHLYNLLFANPFCLLKSTENSKKRKSERVQNRCLVLHFGMNKIFLRVHLLASMHVLNFVFLNTWYVFLMKWEWSYDLVLLINDILKSEVPWKSWLDPRFPWNSMLKWILKWLPLDRDYFKFYFRKGKSILIISCHTYLLTRKFVVLFQVKIASPCILSLLNTSCFDIIDRQSLEKEVAWKLWLEPRFPYHPK